MTRLGYQIPNFTYPGVASQDATLFAACLSDLTIFVTALIAKDADLTREDAVDLAKAVFDDCVRETFESCEDTSLHISVKKLLYLIKQKLSR